MTARITLATAARVLRQLRRDRRTLALVLLVPALLLILFRYVFDGQPGTFDRVGAPMVGIFPLSAFASTEFQAVQFMPAAILPQILLCGLLVPRERMAAVLDWAWWALPMTYAYDGLARATTGEGGARLALDVGVVLGAIMLALALGAATLRRRTS